MIGEILEHNRKFVASRGYETFATSRFPDKKIAIVSCMDSRLTGLLPAALGLEAGDAMIIRNAGGMVSHPFGSVMRSLLIAIHELGVREILVIGHTDCGLWRADSRKAMETMRTHGVGQEKFDMANCCGIDCESWLEGFEDLDRSVQESVAVVRKHPLVPDGIAVHGFVMDSGTGELRRVS